MTFVRTRSLLVLIILLLLSLALITVHQLGYLSPTERFIVQFIAPFQQGASRILTGVRDLRLGLADMGRLRRENEELRAEVSRLQSLAVGLKETQDENRTLRDQLGFSQANPAFDLLPAQVIGRDPDNFIQTIMIDKGLREGVREGKVVVAAGTVRLPADGSSGATSTQTVIQGLVGRVIEAGPNYARVLLISDASSAINVYAQGTMAEGLLAGQGRGSMALQYVRQGERLVPGSVLLSSGLGGLYPRSLSVGMITAVQTKDQATFQTATVIPLVDLARLSIVFVIRSFDPIVVGS